MRGGQELKTNAGVGVAPSLKESVDMVVKAGTCYFDYERAIKKLEGGNSSYPDGKELTAQELHIRYRQNAACYRVASELGQALLSSNRNDMQFIGSGMLGAFNPFDGIQQASFSVHPIGDSDRYRAVFNQEHNPDIGPVDIYFRIGHKGQIEVTSLSEERIFRNAKMPTKMPSEQ